ncbi:MAG TPA: riboflavin synthase [Flavobacteriales bacterium]|nr:riboflavin synthase [Flavobacteriales bacterium]HRO39009.1 riboflavin synthase [Flavobacteriales bacterium]HRP81038.1 riboflavin synthase [Flavobacteriales bacterium]HRQ85703.1 riboflavin synthase [Flavobacteriales bacterium]
MFTGIVEQVGGVVEVRPSGTNADLVVQAPMAGELQVDQSVSHNGVCLTVVELMGDRYRVTAVEETLQRSNLGALRAGDEVNLERSLRLGDRLDGHLVQGHVDTTVECLARQEHQGSWWFSFSLPGQAELLVEKGSVCLNGVSLTIAALNDRSFSVAVIPYTHAHTTFRTLAPGHMANVEFDVLGKYVRRMLEARLTP